MTIRTNRSASTAVVSLLLALTSACGGDDDSGVRAVDDRQATVPSPDPDSTDVGSAPAADAAAVLLDEADLPPGWTELPAEPLDAESAGACIDALVEPAGPFDQSDERTADRSFSRSALGPFLMTSVALPVDDPAAAVAEVERLVLGCDGHIDADGFTTSVEPLPAPEVGEEAVAFRGTATDEGGASVGYLIAVARAGDAVVMAAQAVALGELDAALVEDVLGKMAARAG